MFPRPSPQKVAINGAPQEVEMTYDFTLDKKALVSVLAGWIVMALLLFAAGLIVGTYWTTSGSGGAVVASAKTAGNSRAALPTEPVLTEDDAPLDATAPAKEAGKAKSETATSGQGAAQTQTAAATSDEASKKAAVPPVPEFSEKANQEATLAPPVASAGSDNSAGGSGTFTVQVGVFLEQNEASRLLKEMERKGYSPSFFADRDSEDRQWYAVRIGAYADKDQAANAAANFSKQERIKAVVRPLGSL
jgi:septal ring-binding cell division protein DamX